MKMVHINFSYSRVTYVENVDFSVLASRNRRQDNKNLKISRWDLDFRLCNQEWNWKVLKFSIGTFPNSVGDRGGQIIWCFNKFLSPPLSFSLSSLSQRELGKVYFPTFNTSKMSGFESKSKILIATTTGFAGTVKRAIFRHSRRNFTIQSKLFNMNTEHPIPNCYIVQKKRLPVSNFHNSYNKNLIVQFENLYKNRVNYLSYW